MKSEWVAVIGSGIAGRLRRNTRKLTRLLFDLAQRGDGNGDLVRLQSLEQDAFDVRVDRQRSHFLA